MQRLLNNWSLKLTALILAVALWTHVKGEVNPIETATFTLKPRLPVPAQLTIANPGVLPRDVTVVVRAPRTVLKELRGGMTNLPLPTTEQSTPLPVGSGRAWLDFSLARPGRQEIPVKVTLSNKEAEVLGVKPPNVPLLLQKKRAPGAASAVILPRSTRNG